MNENYSQLTKHEISLLDDLRIARNKISYNGFFITKDYLERKTNNIIQKLKKIINKKLNEK